VHRAATGSGTDPALVHTVHPRASLINGRACCIDPHWRDAVAAGVPPRGLNALPAWAEAGLLALLERAALASAEALTRLP